MKKEISENVKLEHMCMRRMPKTVNSDQLTKLFELVNQKTDQGCIATEQLAAEIVFSVLDGGPQNVTREKRKSVLLYRQKQPSSPAGNARYPDKCLDCGSPAWIGVVAVDCSNPHCQRRRPCAT